MPRFCAHLGYMFNEHPLEERFAAAARHGFPAVEHPSPYAMPAAKVRRRLETLGLTFVQFALPAGAEKGLASLPGREGDFDTALERALEYADVIGCKSVHAQSGIAPPGSTHEERWATYIANLSRAAEVCARSGVTLLIEPISAGTVPGYFMNDARLGLETLAAVGNPNLMLFFDTFHARETDIDPEAFVTTHAERMGHIHIADHPGRHEPGTGDIDFPALFAAVDASTYRGWLGCEYIPAGDTAAGLTWMQDLVPHP
jgi:hydroxypyruvate isomerase